MCPGADCRHRTQAVLLVRISMLGCMWPRCMRSAELPDTGSTATNLGTGAGSSALQVVQARTQNYTQQVYSLYKHLFKFLLCCRAGSRTCLLPRGEAAHSTADNGGPCVGLREGERAQGGAQAGGQARGRQRGCVGSHRDRRARAGLEDQAGHQRHVPRPGALLRPPLLAELRVLGHTSAEKPWIALHAPCALLDMVFMLSAWDLLAKLLHAAGMF